ncbi:endonuclease domain-containing protein [Microbacterium fluvii]|uniref:Endonuclease domain-containing protein n=1 Tax=Microbacterium fluvii TaxID=415215 RepID=A0ABW2HAY6_9MICO|nr:DUF559 domain-containing protein [Microbacterium fluvii]MCU4672100.1 DUF559 domain-containing protein [Microbacterium fluvii]
MTTNATVTAKALDRQTLFRTWIASNNGVAHSAVARAGGFSPSEQAQAVRDGVVGRVRRSWLVSPDCDERRRRAAELGGRVTCVSLAELLGLWTPANTATHVAVQGTASRLHPENATVHWAVGPAPVGRSANEDPVLNMLFHAARCLDPKDALALWESAVRLRKVDPVVLSRVAWRSTAAARIASIAHDLSDSGMETEFTDGMRLIGVKVRQQALIDGHRVDGLIGDRLVVQLDGFAHHSDAASRRRDLEQDARLALRGYTVLRFDYAQVFFEWDYVRDTVITAIAQGLHRWSSAQNR